jgi:hypothetical protein
MGRQPEPDDEMDEIRDLFSGLEATAGGRPEPAPEPRRRARPPTLGERMARPDWPQVVLGQLAERGQVEDGRPTLMGLRQLLHAMVTPDEFVVVVEPGPQGDHHIGTATVRLRGSGAGFPTVTTGVGSALGAHAAAAAAERDAICRLLRLPPEWGL